MKRLNVTQQATEEKTTLAESKRLNLLTAIEQIVELSEGSNLSEEFYVKARRYVRYVAKKLSLTPVQAVLFSLFVNKSDDSCIRISDFATHLRCRTVRIIRYMSDIDVLEKRKLVICCRQRREKTYRISMPVIEALKENRCYEPQLRGGLTCEELFDELDDLFEQRDDSELTYDALVGEINTLFDNNDSLEFVRRVRSYDLAEWDWVLLVYFCHLFVSNDDDNIGPHDFDDLYESKSIFRLQERELVQGHSDLMRRKLVEYVNSDGYADRNAFKLTDQAKEELLGELNISKQQANPDKDLLKHVTLPAKQLFYNEREARQIDQLAALLSPDRFDDIRSRLAASGMRNGFACLFYGAPGTGKTETVYQLAKRTGRDIMQVNFAALKSCWVGESEKNVKALFDRYRTLVTKCDTVPILLFNEADAIIGKRQEGAERAVDKMENSIQNIILQEMESLDGILIATTNLTQNMDKAFERRFLYKIEFERPSLEAKQAIWQSMLPDLTAEEATELASAYDFTGGQIENIARKQAVDKILRGVERVDIETLRQYCDSERIASPEKRRRIGF